MCAAPSVWASHLGSNNDGPLRPTEDHWRQVREMHRFDAGAEQAIWDAPWEDQREPGIRELYRKGYVPRSHVDNGLRSEEGMSEESIIFEHGVKP